MAAKPRFVPINKRPAEDRPRERLLRLGAERLNTSELIAILINQGTRGRSALQVAEELLSSCPEGVSGLARRSAVEIRKTKGLGMAATARVLAGMELGRRAIQRPSDEKTTLDTVEKVATYFRNKYRADAPEKFVALYVNGRRRLLGELEVSRGGSNAVVVDPRLILKDAFLVGAKGMILVHNHPDGSLKPSNHDVDLTRQLIEIANLCRVPVISHVVVTNTDAFKIDA